MLVALIVRLPHIPTLTQRKALGTGKAQLNQAGNMTAVMTTKTRVTRTGGEGDITIIIVVNTHRTRYILTMIGTVIITLVRNQHGLLMESRVPEFPRL